MAAATADVFWAVRQNRTARPAQNFIKGELQSDNAALPVGFPRACEFDYFQPPPRAA